MFEKLLLVQLFPFLILSGFYFASGNLFKHVNMCLLGILTGKYLYIILSYTNHNIWLEYLPI